ncbi:replication protein A 70 kDa DNA-binding subunit B-like isoform X2 [Coffea arabica]|uniref:Replication protein A 70 kDa DNA-binding subunit B-like isoform X2 n=1 Tax=Coffea arabica TaxID=13443 RepID=A0ABM4UYZ7_COFAR|nr:replication protein A 70 kDa DNA-binding subunit B-like [Coffea arabica]
MRLGVTVLYWLRCSCYRVWLRMTNLLPIRDIVPFMKNWSCLITVQEKQQITDSKGTPTKKQQCIFYDAEGSKVEAIIFNDDIPKMSPLLRVYKKYKITNAEVKPIPAKFQTADITIQWVISTKTIIEELNGADNDIMPVNFNYTKFTDLVHHMDDKNKSVDVIGIVMAALGKRTLNRSSKESNVQKFVLLDEESQTVLLSLWDDFLANEGQQLLSNLHSYPVIIVRRIKVNNYKGVALGTWFDFVILVDLPI